MSEKNIKPHDLLESLWVMYQKSSGKYVSSAQLNVDGYVIQIPDKSFDTLDEAVTSIKARIIEARLKFKPRI